MSAVDAPPQSPFKGLAAFEDSELDALFFFGRERERQVLLANLLAARLTVLYGESGVGKSSLLSAAVVRDLRETTDAPIVVYSAWSQAPGTVLGDFADGGEGYLILDQFEEYFLYHDADDSPLLRELPELLANTRVNVLIALREDALARLDVFKARIPGVFGNQVRLEHLDVDQARAAILGPLARWRDLYDEQVDAEPALVDAVIADVAVEGGRVEAPYLQLVVERVWRPSGTPARTCCTARRSSAWEAPRQSFAASSAARSMRYRRRSRPWPPPCSSIWSRRRERRSRCARPISPNTRTRVTTTRSKCSTG
jgi:hypothetical protein